MANVSYTQPGERGFLENGPLVSIIVPIYNMEKYLSRCLDSIIKQTYKNIEIILVNDASTDSSYEIIDRYIEMDDRIKYVEHVNNRGLFQARLTGVEKAIGKYIAFVDSDDYISIDWIRSLLRKAERSCSDITIGDWCYDFNNEYKAFNNLDPFRIYNQLILTGDDVLNAFMKQEGTCYSWTLIWNKLYTKDLWDKCYAELLEFSNYHGHMVMWEDIAFSSVLWANATSVTNTHDALYFYYRHDDSSTRINYQRERNLKYIKDASSAISFMKLILEKKKRYEDLKEHFKQWQENAAGIVYRDLVEVNDEPKYEKIIREAFLVSGDLKKVDDFFYHIKTPLHESFYWQEEIIERITSSKIDYVSFDIFDTLILRPFFFPTDLFEILSNELNEQLSAIVDFKHIRINSEIECRKRFSVIAPSKEEISIDEIYQFIFENYVFDEKLIKELKAREKELEIEYCYTRQKGKDFYECALEADKKIIICSDMYLDRITIEKILKNNGYYDYEKLYLSSELDMTKAQKSLYKFVQKDLQCQDADKIVHIGDNWESDVINAAACGWQSKHLPKTTDLLQHFNPGIYTGEAFDNIFKKNDYADYIESVYSFTGNRSVLALIANYLYDNPFQSINYMSDFNSNPNVIGYYVVGPHLLALSKWIMDIVEKKNIPTIHFVARDGYLVKKAFDILNTTNAKSNYLRLSRKSLMLADVNCKEDLYSIYRKVNILALSPKKLVKYLQPIIPKDIIPKIPSIIEGEHLYYGREFANDFEYVKCMKIFMEKIVNMELLEGYKTKMQDYFKGIVKPGDYIFDIGYSGRPETALSNVLGYVVGSLYVHTNSEMAEKRQQKYGCQSECFYQYKPCITGVMREHLLMELGPSTIGYEEINGRMVPQLEEYTEIYSSSMITTIVQENALNFIRDYKNFFGSSSKEFILHRDVLSAPFEYYLHKSKPLDREMFASVPFEDDLGEGKIKSALEFWNREINIKIQDVCTKHDNKDMPEVLSDLYLDGLFVKVYLIINKLFPKGSTKREIIKKVAKIFVR